MVMDWMARGTAMRLHTLLLLVILAAHKAAASGECTGPDLSKPSIQMTNKTQLPQFLEAESQSLCNHTPDTQPQRVTPQERSTRRHSICHQISNPDTHTSSRSILPALLAPPLTAVSLPHPCTCTRAGMYTIWVPRYQPQPPPGAYPVPCAVLQDPVWQMELDSVMALMVGQRLAACGLRVSQCRAPVCVLCE